MSFRGYKNDFAKMEFRETRDQRREPLNQVTRNPLQRRRRLRPLPHFIDFDL
jgi:hypothetical protein